MLPSKVTRKGLTPSVLGLCLASACTGQLSLPAGPEGAGEDATGGANGGAAALDAGRTGPHRLNNAEYDNTVGDLLGTTLTPAKAFVAEEADGFDNVADAMGMTPSQFESYFNAAEALARDTFADDARRQRVIDCTPSGDDGGACLGTMLDKFGLRAYRRPLTDEQKTGLRAAYGRAIAAGESAMGAAEHVVATMLASPPFLYRFELDAEGEAGRALDGYELAARLSYFLWSTMPDDELLELAASGELAQVDVLRAQVERMLEDPRSRALVDNFAGQWLGVRELGVHKVLAEKYPSFDEDLRKAMITEVQSFFDTFLREELPLEDFFRTKLHFVNARLAKHYGLPAVAEDAGFVRVEEQVGERRGFMGLASFLTVSSFAHRTSPTLRAKWVLEELLCSHLPPPPPNVVGDLDASDAANAAASIENVRERLELHRSDPACAGCHAAMDPIGLGLESFDAIGAARTTYDNGDPVETQGELPDGTTFNGLGDLSDILAKDTRFPVCVTKKMLTYALGRSVAKERDLVADTVDKLAAQGSTLRALIDIIVESPAFRMRGPGGESP